MPMSSYLFHWLCMRKRCRMAIQTVLIIVRKRVDYKLGDFSQTLHSKDAPAGKHHGFLPERFCHKFQIACRLPLNSSIYKESGFYYILNDLDQPLPSEQYFWPSLRPSQWLRVFFGSNKAKRSYITFH